VARGASVANAPTLLQCFAWARQPFNRLPTGEPVESAGRVAESDKIMSPDWSIKRPVASNGRQRQMGALAFAALGAKVRAALGKSPQLRSAAKVPSSLRRPLEAAKWSVSGGQWSAATFSRSAQLE